MRLTCELKDSSAVRNLYDIMLQNVVYVYLIMLVHSSDLLAVHGSPLVLSLVQLSERPVAGHTRIDPEILVGAGSARRIGGPSGRIILLLLSLSLLLLVGHAALRHDRLPAADFQIQGGSHIASLLVEPAEVVAGTGLLHAVHLLLLPRLLLHSAHKTGAARGTDGRYASRRRVPLGVVDSSGREVGALGHG